MLLLINLCGEPDVVSLDGSTDGPVDKIPSIRFESFARVNRRVATLASMATQQIFRQIKELMRENRSYRR